jgi:hypothetical protein
MKAWLTRRGGKHALLWTRCTQLQVLTRSARGVVERLAASAERVVFVCAGNIWWASLMLSAGA